MVHFVYKHPVTELKILLCALLTASRNYVSQQFWMNSLTTAIFLGHNKAF